MRSGGRALTVAVVAIVEIALVAVIILAIIGQRLVTTAGWMEQVPGGRLIIALGALILLVACAILMTGLVSD